MKIKKAVIPAAGLGTRFLPATKAVPKPMLPVFNKPTIQYIVEEAINAGIEEIAIIVSPESEVIKNHFSKNTVLEENLKSRGKTELYDIAVKTRNLCKIEFICQPTPNGLAGAVLMAERFVQNQPFALLLGDEIYSKNDEKSCLEKLCQEYLTTGASQIASAEVFGDDITKYGNFDYVTDTDGRLKVINLVEKPAINEAFSNMASFGRAVLSPNIFTYIKESMKNYDGEAYLTDAYLALAETEGLYACEYTDTRFDIGDKVGYVKANVEYALKDGDCKEDLIGYIKELSNKL